MNQILSVELPKNDSKQKHRTNKNSIILVFSIVLLIFGIGIASTGVFSYYKSRMEDSQNGLQVSLNSKPSVSIEIIDDMNINIIVSHDKDIASVTYNFGGPESELVQGNGRTKLEIKVKLPVGESTINIIAKDINGITGSYQKTFNVEQKPIISLERAENKIQVTTESTINIDTISYYWDEDRENEIVRTINGLRNVTLVDVLEGKHILNVVAKDIQGNEATKSQTVIGDNKPTLNIGTDGQKFIIEASDDEELSKIEITLNSNPTNTEELSDKEYKSEIGLADGVNKLIVKVYNKNGISETKKVKYTKE